MKSFLLRLASAALLLNTGIAQAAPRDRGTANHMSAPPVEIVTPQPQVNPGALSGPPEFGTPPVNPARSPPRPSSVLHR